ncbi:MAG: hypothetical protein U0838_08040 [Chloroflexota bacterium]
MSAEEALSNLARFFDILRAQSSLLPDDRAIFLAPHLQTLISAGDDPATADIDPDADAVAVMTVHRRGLEFLVYRGHRHRALPGHRAPGAARAAGGDSWTRRCRRGLPAPGGAPALLCRHDAGQDELILSHAADYGGARARRVSPFVLEARPCRWRRARWARARRRSGHWTVLPASRADRSGSAGGRPAPGR